MVTRDFVVPLLALGLLAGDGPQGLAEPPPATPAAQLVASESEPSAVPVKWVRAPGSDKAVVSMNGAAVEIRPNGMRVLAVGFILSSQEFWGTLSVQCMASAGDEPFIGFGSRTMVRPKVKHGGTVTLLLLNRDPSDVECVWEFDRAVLPEGESR